MTHLGPVIIHSFYIARDAKDELNMFTFESPEVSWDESWATGDQILKHLMIDVNNPRDRGPGGATHPEA